MPTSFAGLWASSASPANALKKVIYQQPQDKTGLLVTEELDKAIQECRTKVERISKDCHAEFDLEGDSRNCLFGVEVPEDAAYPPDVQRVTQLFEKPTFFRSTNEACASDIHQGRLGDCWFLSALATISAMKGLVEQLCVARDEAVGVYGFIFFRETTWVPIIVDDLLFTRSPKWEELSAEEQDLYHGKKDKYDSLARKGGRGLYFARCGGEEGQRETWVPLIEKAFAKLHGDYNSLSGGQTGEGLEDLTGGVSTLIRVADILDSEKFWQEELLRVNNDRLFGCGLFFESSERNDYSFMTKSGLVAGHAYSILRCTEVKGKKFVVLRNPWGYSQSEWAGPWSDGSKEWTQEWLEVLPQIGHTFSRDDGQFIMEYSDFLATWYAIDRTLLFDASWAMSSHMLRVDARPLPSISTWGDVSFSIEINESSPAVIVLSQLDKRYFQGISGQSEWHLDFTLFKKGETEPIAEDVKGAYPDVRSVNLEVQLSRGEYIVHVRIGRNFDQDTTSHEDASSDWDQRKLSRVLAERAKSRALASNFSVEDELNNLPVPQGAIAGISLSDLTLRSCQADERRAKEFEQDENAKSIKVVTTSVILEKTVTTDSRTGEVVESSKEIPAPSNASPDDAKDVEKADTDDSSTKGDSKIVVDGKDQVYLGLRVYTKKNAIAEIHGHLRQDQNYKNLALEDKWWTKA